MWKGKAFGPGAWTAFLSTLKWFKETADKNSSAVSGLGDDFAAMTELTAREMAAKQDNQNATPFSIQVEDWAMDETVDCPYYCDMPVMGVTARDRVDFMLDRVSQAEAWACGMSTISESLNGIVRLRAVKAPAKALTGEYWIEQGKE